MTYYDRAYKIPKYVFLLDINSSPKIRRDVAIELLNQGYRHFDWPAAKFMEILGAYARKGYHEVLNQEMPFFLDQSLATRAIIDTLKTFNPYPGLDNAVSYSAVDRRIAGDSDYPRIFNDVLKLNDDISLSQIFQTKNDTVGWYSFLPHYGFPIDRIAEEVLTFDRAWDDETGFSDLPLKKKASTLLGYIEKE